MLVFTALRISWSYKFTGSFRLLSRTKWQKKVFVKYILGDYAPASQIEKRRSQWTFTVTSDVPIQAFSSMKIVNDNKGGKKITGEFFCTNIPPTLKRMQYTHHHILHCPTSAKAVSHNKHLLWLNDSFSNIDMGQI